MRKNLPNQLTMLRLILAGVFFLVLNQYRYEGPGMEDREGLLLGSAVVLFVLAAITDALDGHLARRWKVESRFGRIMDPVCDKVLVIGAFMYLAGPRFVIPDRVEANSFFNMASGIYPWMVVLILLRELLVTSIRGEMEGEGVKFGAKMSGKLKMILQSIVIPIVLVLVWIDPVEHRWAEVVRDVLVYLTVVVTVVSGIPYITGVRRVLRGSAGS